MLFNPTRDESREFFFEAWRKHREGLPVEGLEPMVIDIMIDHPEYHRLLDDPESCRGRDWPPEGGETNPFLHMGLHLALAEQRSIDQPVGIRVAYETLLRRKRNRHDADHAALECLVEMIWQVQRYGASPDLEAYVKCVRRGGKRWG